LGDILEENKLTVSKIKEGTVIDHIAAGKGLLIPHILGLDFSTADTFTVLVNAKSTRMRKKDIVKIQNRELKKKEVDIVALIAPNATINIIKNYDVVEKRKAVLPKQIEGLLRCLNNTCITNNDREAHTKFELISASPLNLRCAYCGANLNESEALSQLSGRRESF
jgi:aspartate carbamoyltransferase regulatory subunit